jgi:hypothetical protein
VSGSGLLRRTRSLSGFHLFPFMQTQHSSTLMPARVWIDHDAGIIYVVLAEPAHDRQAHRTNSYLGKFGVATDWDGHGTLLGLEIKAKDGVTVQVRD